MSSLDSPVTASLRRRGPVPGTPRGPRMNREQRRAQLLDIAEAAFGDVGFHDTTMDMVAALAQVTKPVLYDHFGSKENLLAAVVVRAKDDLVTTLTAALMTVPADVHAKEVVRAAVTAFMVFIVKREAAFRAYLQEDAVMRVDDRSRDAIRGQFAEMIRDIVLFIPGVSELAPGKVLVIAEMVIAIAERAAAWALRTDVDLQEATDLTVDFLWGGLRGQLPQHRGH